MTTYLHKCPLSETTSKRVKLNLSHTLQHRRMAWVDARDCVIRLRQAVKCRGKLNKIIRPVGLSSRVVFQS